MNPSSVNPFNHSLLPPTVSGWELQTKGVFVWAKSCIWFITAGVLNFLFAVRLTFLRHSPAHLYLPPPTLLTPPQVKTELKY